MLAGRAITGLDAAGGLAVQLGSWRALFLVVVPLVLLLVVLIRPREPEPAQSRYRKCRQRYTAARDRRVSPAGN